MDYHDHLANHDDLRGRVARDADGGFGPERIADILDTDELPVAASTTTEISVGDD